MTRSNWLACALLALFLPALGAASTPAFDDGEWTICSNQFAIETANFAAAPIKSRAALNSYMRDGGGKRPPLSYLSNGAQQRFVRSITFNESGVTGYSYNDLERELTLTQAYEVLGLIGEQQNIKFLKDARIETELDKELHRMITSPAPACDNGDRSSYRCASRATCSWSTAMICKSNC
jgi:hypothetical protein